MVIVVDKTARLWVKVNPVHTHPQPTYLKFIFLGTFEQSRKASISFVIVLVCLSTYQQAGDINSP